MNKNTPKEWDRQWSSKQKFFPIYVMKRIVQLVPEGSSVLDIGCGTGSMLKKLKEKKSSKVYGIDISPYAIEQCIKSGIPAKVGNAENLDDFKGEYDVVVSAHLFEHITHDKNLAKNVGRLTKKFALVCVPNNSSYPEETGLHVRKYNILTLIRLLAPYFLSFENHTVGNHLLLKCLK